MLNISKSAFIREIQVRFSHSNKSWVDLVAIQNVRAKKSFAFEPNMRFVLKSLRQLLTCTESKAYSIYDQFPTIRSIDMMNTVGNNIEILMKNGISSETIIENPFLLVMTEDVLQNKLDILNMLSLSGYTFNDLVPLLEMKEDRLKQACDSMVAESHLIPGGNRIYYFSHKLKIEPNIVAKYCVKNEYSLIAPFDVIDRKMQILLDYNIKPLSILKTLYALDRSEHVYVSRLERLMSLNTKDVKLWFFKCADDVFEMYLNRMQTKTTNHSKENIEAKGERKIRIENQLSEMLECDSEDAARIYYNQINHFDQIDSAKRNIEFLRSQGVSLETITSNSAVLAMSSEQLQQKLRILDRMDPRHIDDFLPLICVDKTELDKFKAVLEEQELYESSENPIYYFSERLKVPPSVVASHFAKSPSIFFRSPKMLNQKLDMLLACGVELNSILNSPLTFRMNLNKMENLLMELKSRSTEPISSWMLTCPEAQLNTMIERQEKQRELLNGCGNAIDYIGKRLNWDEKTKISALKSCPALAKCNMTKIRQQLDFLLNETHFTEDDISSYPRVFTNSLKKLRTRMNELATVKYKAKRLYIICLERKRYLEIIEKHCQCIDDENVWINFREIEKRIKEK
ncbi:transcription termination factor, mitochondrial-like [Sitodiplosis mosellana]|uniref:transcription termination factor, mitochondrial-like n=1 Tax=Sitodiplosis mosellana TaxID=263140 RepID=UPI0024449B82|nr:transcription termination factor, mitochondrial-like [Sitodiplosis mosellana]